MKQRGTLLAVFAVIVSATFASLMHEASAQEADTSIRQRLVVMPANQRCKPAWVMGVGFGRQPKDAVLAQVLIENNSDKVIAAVKMGWKVYDYAQGLKVAPAYCATDHSLYEVLLSGKTPLIQLGGLVPKGKCNVAIDPLPVPMPATMTVFIDHPLVTTSDLKTLRLDGSTPKIKYTLVIYLSEIRFDDGSLWQAPEVDTP